MIEQGTKTESTAPAILSRSTTSAPCFYGKIQPDYKAEKKITCKDIPLRVSVEITLDR